MVGDTIQARDHPPMGSQAAGSRGAGSPHIGSEPSDVDRPAAGQLLGAGDGYPRRRRASAAFPAPARLCSPAPELDCGPQGTRGPRIRGEKGAVGAVLSHPPDDAEVYLQDEAQMALHPTLIRMWMKRGRGRQGKIRAPGANQKRHVFGATDWRDGAILHRDSDSRDSVTFCALADECVARSRARGRRAILALDNLNIHVPERAKKVRDLYSGMVIGWSSSTCPSTRLSCNRRKLCGGSGDPGCRTTTSSAHCRPAVTAPSPYTRPGVPTRSPHHPLAAIALRLPATTRSAAPSGGGRTRRVARSG